MKLHFVLLLLFSFFLLECTHKNDLPEHQKSNIDLFGQYIIGYSQSPVSRCNDLYIHLAFKIPDSITISPNLITSTPDIGGQVQISKDRKTIQIVHPSIKHNVRYEIAFHIHQLTQMPKGLETFRFKLEAKRQSWRIVMQPPVCESMDIIRLKGKIVYDVCEPDQSIFKDALKASQDGKKLPVRWEAFEKNRREVQFEISNIKRSNIEGKVDITLSMQPINVEDEAELHVIVPSKSDFSLYATKIESNRHLALYFTDPIKSGQILDGLVRVEGRRIGSLRVSHNTIDVYFSDTKYGEYPVNISPGILNIAGFPLKDTYKRNLFFAPPKPHVSIAEKGNILPPSGHWELPVSIVSASGFRLRILRVHPQNTHRFFQENGGLLNAQTGLENLGRIQLDTTFEVDTKEVYKTSIHSIVLDRQVNKETGALYKVFLSIPPQHNQYPCKERQKYTAKDEVDQINFDKPYLSAGYDYDYYYDNANVGHSSFRDREENPRYLPDPCSGDYAGIIHDQRLLVCTDVGLVVKSEPGASRYFAYVSRISTAAPIQGAKVQLYDFQGAPVGSATTDETGRTLIHTRKTPYLAKARANGQYTYLTLADAKALETSLFNVEGHKWKGSDKVFFYGERDVWRPGDSVYLQCMVYNRTKALPKHLPIRLTLLDPTDKKMKEWTVVKHQNGLYDCRFATRPNDLTGYWTLQMQLGGETFTKHLRIETVRPNRLKIAMAFDGEDPLTNEASEAAPITVKWMHGLPAKGLKTEVHMLQKTLQNPFGSRHKNYLFDDITQPYSEDLGQVKSGKTNENGILPFRIPIQKEDKYPGMMLFNFEVRAFEKGGAFSTDLKTIKYSPYSSYVGIKLPSQPIGGLTYLKDKAPIHIRCLDPKGGRISRKVKVTYQNVRNKWWYQFGSYGDYTALKNKITGEGDTYTLHIDKGGTTITPKGMGIKLLTIEDVNSGHRVRRFVYLLGSGSNPGGELSQLEVLPFYIEKEDYKIGEFMDFTLPALRNGRFLITVESGGKIVYSEVRRAENQPITRTIRIDKSMIPTAYVHVHFIQAWNTYDNDRPLRLYGVKAIQVYDPQTVLDPEINMEDEIRADKPFVVQVSERNDKPMTYTLALVDEGLLDITQFHTPNPWRHFFSKEALSVKTWDIYRDIFHRFLGEYTSLLAVGGDGANTIKPTAKARRFKPVVKFLGPFTLQAGASARHRLTIKDYVGSVRVMVVATDGKAFGHNQKAVPVKKPLMLYTTLPRVLGPGESLKVPVTVFAMDPKVKQVTVQMTTNHLIETKGEAVKRITFDKQGEKDISFDVTIPNAIGVGKVEVKATSGAFTATSSIDIDVRPASAKISKTVETLIPPKSEKNISFHVFGMPGTQSAKLVIRKGINLSFEPWVRHLARYPHGCIEQTVSSIFPQIMLQNVGAIDEGDKMVFRQHYDAAIQKLRYMQTASGGFSYWPGGNVVNSWGTTYALDFLLEANQQGYDVPGDMLSRVVAYQYNRADEWTIPSTTNNRTYDKSASYDQAYRLLTLARAQKPNYAALNRLRLVPQLPSATKWLLGYALLLVGEQSSADKILKEATTTVDDYQELSGTFGSALRDQAMMLRVLVAQGKKLLAKRVADEMTKKLNEKGLYGASTQEIAQCLIGFSRFMGALDHPGKPISFDVELSDDQILKNQTIDQKPITIPLKKKAMERQSATIRNNGDAGLFASVVLSGIPVQDESPAEAQDLTMRVTYTLEDGTPVDPSKLSKGTDFIAQYNIKHNGQRMDYENLALTIIFPSGWELFNHRLNTTFAFDAGSSYDYQDLRDDRAYTYFNLKRGKSKVFRFKLNASYAGKYWAPGAFCEAMYAPSIRAKSKGFWIIIE